MDLFQAIIYGIVQGLTEFLPVSSTAHLVLLPWFAGWQDPGMSFDIALHLGTLFSPGDMEGSWLSSPYVVKWR